MSVHLSTGPWQVHTFDSSTTHPTAAAIAPIDGDWVAIRFGSPYFFGMQTGTTDIGVGILFHEGIHLAGHHHGTIPGYTSSSLHCVGGQWIL